MTKPSERIRKIFGAYTTDPWDGVAAIMQYLDEQYEKSTPPINLKEGEKVKLIKE